MGRYNNRGNLGEQLAAGFVNPVLGAVVGGVQERVTAGAAAAVADIAGVDANIRTGNTFQGLNGQNIRTHSRVHATPGEGAYVPDIGGYGYGQRGGRIFSNPFNRGQAQHGGSSQEQEVTVADPRDFERGGTFNPEEYERIGDQVPENVDRVLHSELPRDGERGASVDPRTATARFASLVALANAGIEGAAEAALAVAEQLRGRDGEIHLRPGWYKFALRDREGEVVRDRNGVVMVQVKFDRTDHNEDSRALFNATSAAIEAQGGGYFVNAYDLSATIIPAGTSAPERAGAENGGYERITGDGDAVRQAAVINPETGLPAASSAPLKGLYPEGEAPAVKEAGVADKAADTRTRVAASPYASMYDHQPQVKMTTEQVGAFQDAILAQGGRLADAMKAHGGRDSKPGKAFFAALAETVGKENATSIDFTNSGEFAKLLAKAGSAKSQASVAGVEAPASAAALAASLPPSFDGALAGRPAGLVIPGQAAGAAPTSSGAANVLFSGFGFSPAEAGAPKANEVESVVAWSDVYRLRTAPTPDNLPAALAKNSPVPSGEQVAYLSSAPEYLNAAKPAELDYSSLAGVSPLKVPDARTAEQRSSQASAGRHT